MAYYKIKDSKGVYDIYQFKNEAEARSKLYPGEQIVGLVREADAIANKYTAKDMPHMKTLSEARKEAKYETGAGWNERRYKAAKEATKDEKGSTAKRAMKQLAPRLVESAERQDLGEDISTLQDLKKGQQDVWSLPGRGVMAPFDGGDMSKTEGIVRDPTLFATMLSAGALTPMVAGAYAPSALATGWGSLIPMATAGAITENLVSGAVEKNLGDGTDERGLEQTAIDMLSGGMSAGWKGRVAKNAVKGMFKDGIDPAEILSRYPTNTPAGLVRDEVQDAIGNAGKYLVRDQVSPLSKTFDSRGGELSNWLNFLPFMSKGNTSPQDYIKKITEKGKPYQDQLDVIVNTSERNAMKPQEIFPDEVVSDVMSRMSTDEQSKYAGDIFNNVEKLLIDRANIPGRETSFSTAMMGPLFKDVIDNTPRPIPKYGDLFPIGDAQSSAIRGELNDVVTNAVKAKRYALQQKAPELLETDLARDNVYDKLLGNLQAGIGLPKGVTLRGENNIPLVPKSPTLTNRINQFRRKVLPENLSRPKGGTSKNYESRANAIEAQLLGRLKEIDRENLLSYLTKTDAKRAGAGVVDLLLGTGARVGHNIFNTEEY